MKVTLIMQIMLRLAVHWVVQLVLPDRASVQSKIFNFPKKCINIFLMCNYLTKFFKFAMAQMFCHPSPCPTRSRLRFQLFFIFNSFLLQFFSFLHLNGSQIVWENPLNVPQQNVRPILARRTIIINPYPSFTREVNIHEHVYENQKTICHFLIHWHIWSNVYCTCTNYYY